MVLFRAAIAWRAEDIGWRTHRHYRSRWPREAFRQLVPRGFRRWRDDDLHGHAPKSNSVVKALSTALELARETPAERCRWPPAMRRTALLKKLGY